MYTGSQRRTVRSLKCDVGCKFEFVNVPSMEDVLEASAEQAIVTLDRVHPESIAFFTPTAEKLIEDKGTTALAAALAQQSRFAQPPSSWSLITHGQEYRLRKVYNQTHSNSLRCLLANDKFVSAHIRPKVAIPHNNNTSNSRLVHYQATTSPFCIQATN
ncbi:unnamed protein product [Trifolium pratense]|uniref:Uncharacterized protein n=1 Tax=Trifolium pratense TaxID=57577 RepID=A0ACB0J1P6_TRIPR|nr:unnamed protein product [Trifolium pratense]